MRSLVWTVTVSARTTRLPLAAEPATVISDCGSFTAELFVIGLSRPR
jgi:hypothetical protein